jgi:arginyl-tRNA synthetase
MGFRKRIIEMLKVSGLPSAEINKLLTVPPNSNLGDFAFPCFTLGKNPKQAAEDLKGKIKAKPFLAKIDVAGPYLNFFIKPSVLAEEVLSQVLKEQGRYGQDKGGKNIVLEYCGPNTNKPLHVGHLRNMALGQAVHHLLDFVGHQVHPVNIINDRGIHICKSMLAYQKWGKNAKPNKKTDHFVGDYYVLFAQKLEKDPELATEAQEMLLKWERGDKETRALWRKMNDWVITGLNETYQRFGVEFEKEYFESEYYEQGKEVVEEGVKKKLFEEDHEGTIMAPLEGFGLPNKILLRGDKTSLYITQDMYLAQLRYEDFKFDQMIYVVASEQNLHFQQLFRISELLKRPYAGKLYHLSYGMVNLTTGKMKSREGTVIDADNLMDDIQELANKEVKSRFPELSEGEIKRRAEFISQAAIKFFLVKTDAIRDQTFNPKESVSFEGETGPYLQYTHARASSILRKAKIPKKIEFHVFDDPVEKKLINLVGEFPDVVKEAATHYKVHVLCRYLLDLAQSFNEFYHACPVISPVREVMNARLWLVEATRQVLCNGLDILGITAPKEM